MPDSISKAQNDSSFPQLSPPLNLSPTLFPDTIFNPTLSPLTEAQSDSLRNPFSRDMMSLSPDDPKTFHFTSNLTEPS